MGIKLGLAVAIILTAMFGLQAFAEPSAAGFWEQTDDGGEPLAWIFIEQKNGVFDGRYIRLFPAPGAKQETTCDKCQGARKGARILGLTSIYGLKREGLCYRGGHIIDMRDGTTWGFRGNLSDDGTEFHVSNYIGSLYVMTTLHRLSGNAINPKNIPKEVLRHATVE